MLFYANFVGFLLLLSTFVTPGYVKIYFAISLNFGFAEILAPRKRKLVCYSLGLGNFCNFAK